MFATIKYLLSLFYKSKLVEQPKETIVSVKEVITLKDYLTASGSYPERETHKELTPEYLENAKKLLTKVNQLLADLGVTSAKISSGFRPTAVNAATKGAAKKSGHLICKSIDFQDLDGSLDLLFDKNQDLLEKYGLWQEHPSATKNWAHCDMVERVIRERSNCKKRQFNP
jgi:Peptidase M15